MLRISLFKITGNFPGQKDIDTYDMLLIQSYVDPRKAICCLWVDKNIGK